MFNGVLYTSKLKHNPKAISKLYSNKGDSVVASDTFYIMFPERYINKGLATMGTSVKLLSVYAIVDKNMNYGVITAPVFMDIIPTNVTSVMVDGVVNKVLEIGKGETFILNRNLIKSATFMYDVFDEFFLQGKVPWYISYDKLSDLFAESKKYANSDIGSDSIAIEIITSIVSRSIKDPLVSYRESIKSSSSGNKPKYVGLNNVFYSYDNTLSKVMGGYMQLGVTISIVNRESKSTKVSTLLRA
jgi:hypothetical protein